MGRCQHSSPTPLQRLRRKSVYAGSKGAEYFPCESSRVCFDKAMVPLRATVEWVPSSWRFVPLVLPERGCRSCRLSVSMTRCSEHVLGDDLLIDAMTTFSRCDDQLVRTRQSGKQHQHKGNRYHRTRLSGMLNGRITRNKAGCRASSTIDTLSLRFSTAIFRVKLCRSCQWKARLYTQYSSHSTIGAARKCRQLEVQIRLGRPGVHIQSFSSIETTSCHRSRVDYA